MADRLTDPQDLIPPKLQSDWVVVPRGAGYWLFAQSAVFGAGLALTAGSWFRSDHAGWWPAILVALGVMVVNAFLMKRQSKRWLAKLPVVECPNETAR